MCKRSSAAITPYLLLLICPAIQCQSLVWDFFTQPDGTGYMGLRNAPPPVIPGYAVGFHIPIVLRYEDKYKGSIIALLPKDKNLQIHAAFDALKGRFSNMQQDANCKVNVLDKLHSHAGFQASDMLRYFLKGGYFFDGVHSTVNTAGLIAPQPGSYQFTMNLEFTHDYTHKDVNGKVTHSRTEALTSMLSPKFLVFFNSNAINGSSHGANKDNEALLFHEGLHAFLAPRLVYDDCGTEVALGIFKGQCDGKQPYPASVAITNYVRDHCFH